MNNRTWLNEHYKKRKARTLKLVIASVNQLLESAKEVTLSSISEISKVIDIEGKGIHPNTIKSNLEAYEYYKKHSKTYQRKAALRKIIKASNDKIEFEKIKLDRNEAALRSRYMKMTKKELVERLIQAENYIAENYKNWIINQFEGYVSSSKNKT